MRRCSSPRRSPRGYSLAIVLLTLGLLTVGMVSLLAILHAGTTSTNESLRQREVFYACDGGARIIGKVVGEYARSSTVGTVDDMRTYLEGRGGGAKLPKLIPDGFVLKRYEITDFVRSENPVPVATGPFAGLPAREQRFNLMVEAQSADGEIACRVDQQLAVSELGIFNFTLFAAARTVADGRLTSQHSDPAGATYLRGWSHINGTLCVGARADPLKPSTWFDRITALAINMNNVTSGTTIASVCQLLSTEVPPVGGKFVKAGATNPWNATGPNTTDFVAVDSFNEVGSATFSGEARWEGVQPLMPPHPYRRSRPKIQRTSTPVWWVHDNQKESLREFINAPDETLPPELRPLMLAYKSDIRIIDGVWYLKPAGDPLAWPGRPIWSDHAVSAKEPPGQNGLKGDLKWTKIPRRFSYYAYDSTKQQLLVDVEADGATRRAVVSYGALRKVDDFWEPAVWAPAGGEADWAYCNASASGDGEIIPLNAFARRCGNARSMGDNLLHATRQGRFHFRDQHDFDDNPADSERGSTMLPVNIDLRELELALKDTTPGELGSYFPPSRPFNGIIFLGAEWPGSRKIDEPGPSAEAERLSELPDASAAIQGPTKLATAPGVNAILPFPLCTKEEIAMPTGEYLDAIGHSLPPCSDKAFTLDAEPRTIKLDNASASALYIRQMSWPNNFRLINGARLNPANFPRGLTVASNLEITIVGDLNLQSVPAGTAAEATDLDALGQPWMPMLVAADLVHVVPSYWPGPKPASFTTTIHSAVWTGASDSAGEDLLSALRLEGVWSGGRLTYRGSLVVGHEPEWTQAVNYTPLGADAPKFADYGFDYRMAPPVKQPPGGSFITITATRRWDRR
jgi:hypothetical protein